MKLIAAWVVLAALGAIQTPTFSTRVDAVRVDALVSERGRPVPGLTRQDFEVSDNGVPQTIDLVESGEVSLNVVLVYDLSESVTGDRRENLNAASKALLEGLQTDDQAALMTFNDGLSLRCVLNRERSCITNALEQADGIGLTALIDATYAAFVLGESDPGRSLVMIFSDGVDTASWLTAMTVTTAAGRSDAVVYAVSVGQSQRPQFLHDVAEATGGRLLEVEDTKNLRVVFLNILNEYRQRYVITYTPRGVSPSGWHRLSVRVKRRGPSVRARPGYLAGEL